MKKVRITGSKFDLCLEDEEAQWYLRLRIQNKIEEELPLTHIEEKLVKRNISELLEKVHLSLSDVQLQMLHKDIWDAIQTTLNLNKQKAQKNQFGLIRDKRVDVLLDRVDRLKSKIEQLENRISANEVRLT